MMISTIRPRKMILLLISVAVFLVSELAGAGEVVEVELSDGQQLAAKLHPRTNTKQLWLQFGGGSAVVLRAVSWQRVVETQLDGKSVSTAELREKAAASDGDQPEAPATTEAVPPSRPSYAGRARKLLGFQKPIKSINFDSYIANWDGDVEFDGLVVRLFPLDAAARVTPARGTLHVELITGRRPKFKNIPNAREKDPGRIGKWTVSVAPEEVTKNGTVVKLPFQTVHPEFDTNWAGFGLVHVRFVAPGHGVFEHSLGGVRIRPFAPQRDGFQRGDRSRFLPTEQTGIGRHISN